MNLKNRYLSVFCYLFISLIGNSISAQDTHFSQSYNTPMLINPSLTGVFNGQNRGFVNHRQQWGFTGNPFTSYMVAVDANYGKDTREKSYLGVGLLVFSDKAGELAYGTLQASLAISGMYSIDEKQLLSFGIIGGVIQKSIDQSNMQWGSQYNGHVFDQSLTSGENSTFQNFINGDIGFGANYSYGNSKTTAGSNDAVKFNGGFAAYHINQSKSKFYTNNNSYKMQPRYVVHASGYFGVPNSTLSIIPSTFIQIQGPAKEIAIGSLIRYRIKEESKFTGILKESAFYGGLYYRFKDAIIPSVQYEYANYMLGLSYDINISPLMEVSNTKGGFEISFRYMTPNPFKVVTKVRNVRLL